MSDEKIGTSIQKVRNRDRELLNQAEKALKDIDEFVKEQCNGRDESHGYAHMKKVADNADHIWGNMKAIDIMEELNTSFISADRFISIPLIIKLSCMLHDVADRKYDKDGKLALNVQEFLMKYFDKEQTDLIINIIDRVSFSKEQEAIKSGERKEWENTLGSEGLFIRNIVSDADKLEALGEIGFQRCKEYKTVKYHQDHGKEISNEELKAQMMEHGNEKLFHLRSKWMHTSIAKKMAIPLEQKLKDMINGM